LMTTVFYHDSQGAQLKPRLQLEQEMGIIIAHGGRYFAWDNPTPESGLIADRYEMMGRVVTPFLRARQPWCLGSRALPDISIFHGAAAHYEQSAASPVAFPRQNSPLLAACEGLRRLHLSPEMISDRRLEQGDIRSRLLFLEDTLVLTDANRRALHRYVENGGRVLLTGKAVSAARLVDTKPPAASVLTRYALGKGEVFCLPQPLFMSATNSLPMKPGELLQQILPSAERLLTTDAPGAVELLLRERDSATILHAVNIAPGKRERDPKALSFLNLHIAALPPTSACHVSVRLPQRPLSVTLQPQDKPITGWTWREGWMQFTLPSFETHQMVVIVPLKEKP
ncbi:MAG: hypothetical protein WC429_11195, partial [Verrucomicrobiia bacterium]